MTIIQYQHVAAWATAQGVDPKRLFDLVPSEIPGYSVLYYKSSMEIPEFTGTAVVCPVRVRHYGCPIVFADPSVQWGPTHQAGTECESVDPAMTPEEAFEWAIKEQIDPSQAVVVDWVPIEHNTMYVNCKWLAFGLGDDFLQVARKPSRVKGYSRMLYRVPQGCPLIYPKLGMSSTVEDKYQAADSKVVSQPFSILPGVITSEEECKWAVKEGVDPKRS
ncbi:hypothetical protein XELAEV_18014024mg [Xenopus laevis]|uniref:Uncharacterized protein n=1 Tax=Xenopus laevis TaxID=8355 RepID=A0A974HZY6_XENLA|nr:hypothetical protein XELAEV_18014024mg [Xenopus laevis]